MTTTTPEIYSQFASNLVWSCMNGYNGTIFAYGQTASGKTYTMKGEGKKNPGIIPLAIHDVFRFIKQTKDREFVLRVSYLEIYNEIINDLLAPESVNLKIHEDKKVEHNMRQTKILERDICWWFERRSRCITRTRNVYNCYRRR